MESALMSFAKGVLLVVSCKIKRMEYAEALTTRERGAGCPGKGDRSTGTADRASGSRSARGWHEAQ
jgi:hypothetical protein